MKQAEQVTVDEAVAAKGGLPGSLKEQVDAATGATEERAKREAADQRFAADEPVRLPSRVEYLPVAQIHPSPRNPRATLGSIEELAAAVAKEGVLSPLIVRAHFEEWEVISGHRRLAAAKQAELDEVPCIVLHDIDDARALELNLAEQVNRKDLMPLEEGEACRQLMELSGYTAAQVAEKLGQSPSWVTKRVALCGLAPEAKKALTSESLALSVAMGLAALPTHALQVKGLEVTKRMAHSPVDETLRALQSEVCRPLRDATWKLTDDTVVMDAPACSACPHNSSNARMPGLFDRVHASPTCANPPCFEEKVRSAWKRAAAKHVDDGAKLLSVVESEKLWKRGPVLDPDTSRYIEADAPAVEDRSKRTWRELVTKAKADVQVFVARKAGKPVELYESAAVLKVCNEKLKLAWAKPEEDNEKPVQETAEDRAQKEAERAAREVVQDQVLKAVVKTIAKKGPTLADLRAVIEDYDVAGCAETLELNDKETKALKGTTSVNQLLAVLWESHARFSPYGGFEPEFLALAEAHGFKPQEMVEAQLNGAKAEALFVQKGKR